MATEIRFALRCQGSTKPTRKKSKSNLTTTTTNTITTTTNIGIVSNNDDVQFNNMSPYTPYGWKTSIN